MRVDGNSQSTPDIQPFELRSAKQPLVSIARDATLADTSVDARGPDVSPVCQALPKNRKYSEVATAVKPSVDAQVRIAARIPLHQENTRLPCKNCDAANPKYRGQIGR